MQLSCTTPQVGNLAGMCKNAKHFSHSHGLWKVAIVILGMRVTNVEKRGIQKVLVLLSKEEEVGK